VSELPKFVLQRFSATGDAGEHPSADLLAAFSEQALTGKEREGVLAHLAACTACRDVLWRSLPEPETAAPAVAAAKSRAGIRMPAWRWVGVAAGAVVIASVALVYRGGSGAAGENALRKAPAVVAQVQSPAAPVQAAKQSPRPAPSLQAPLEAKNEGLKVAPARRRQLPQNTLTSTDTLAKSADKDTLQASAPAPAAPAATAKAARAAAAPAATADAGVMIASNLDAPAMGKKKLAAPTRWMLSSDGQLLRSTDGGKNWQTVPFAGNLVFRSVAVIGPNVWVGGQGGALYYSGDDGSQWHRLSPASDGVPLAQDISALSFQDAQHGNLTTADGQTWTTSDGGRTWQKQ